MYPLFTLLWWKAAAVRAVRTAIVIAIPYVAASTAGPLPYYTIASAAGLGIILSLLTSLAGLAELQDTKQNYFVAVLTRVTKTVAQALVAAVGTTVFITDISWSTIGSLALTSGVGSLLLALLSTLPEADVPASGATTIINNVGGEQNSTVPLVATTPVESTPVEAPLPEATEVDEPLPEATTPEQPLS